MKNNFTLLIGLLICVVVFGPFRAFSQVAEVRHAVYSDVSIPLRDMQPANKHFWEKLLKGTERKVPNKFRKVSDVVTKDEAVQSFYNNGEKAASASVPIMNFNGMTNANNVDGRVTPPDPAGDVGPNHYVQAVNSMLKIYNKTGTSVFGPVRTSVIWSGFSGNWDGHNDGDAIILYDENADRWIISQFAIDCPGTPYTEYQMVAVSTSPDPTGSYYRYAFQFDYMPDYGKLGVWSDGYYLSVNRFNTNGGSTSFAGVGAAVMERSKMLTGDPSARMVYFKTETLGGSGSASGSSCFGMLPSDCDGLFPPAGTPNYFTYDSQSPPELRIWALHADWTTPTNSTFTYTTALPVAAFSELGSVSQQGTTNKLSGLGDRLMFRNQYRNFGSYETFVTCRSVTVSGSAGIRWYEYRKTGSAFSLYQQSTYAPGDGKSRWMGSIAMNAIGDIGLAYSVSSGTMFPSIYFTGRKATDALNQLTFPEGIIQTGTLAMTGADRWGDYSSMSIDPTDNMTFWTSQEYVGTYGGSWPWATKIASFKLMSSPIVSTLAATDIAETSATLNGTVNPHAYATSYHFEWGTTTGYGSSSETIDAGAGVDDIAVTAQLSGLTSGVTYHFRIVAVNSEGTSNGDDFSFTTGAAIVTTSSISGISLSGAMAGGNVLADGGSAVTAKGVCWGTTTNPTISGNFTSDGDGLGTYTSVLAGLAPNTGYFVRAYATNSTGTFYGNNIQFRTICESGTLPFTESFTGLIIPNCWTQIDHQGNGQIWLFGFLANQTPLPSMSGTYAYLNSNQYGTGNSQNADLVSPSLDLTAFSSVRLQFKNYFKYYPGTSGTLSYSIDNGTSWVQIQQFTSTSLTNPALFNQVIDAVSGKAGVMFKWNYTGTYGYSWSIDNVSVTGTVATLSATPSNQNVTEEAGNVSFAVTSNSTWNVVSDQEWCSVSSSGTGNGTLTATYTQNQMGMSRIANITISVPGIAPVVVTVTQSGVLPTLDVSPANQSVTASAGNFAFNVASNAYWVAVCNESWCTVDPSGTGNGTITASYAENALMLARTAYITVTVAGMTPVIVSVTQDAALPSLAVFPLNQDVTVTSGSTSFSVTSNVNWTVSSDQAWCTGDLTGSGNGTLTLYYTANVLVSPRVAHVTFLPEGLNPVVVTVSQEGAAPLLSLSPVNQDGTEFAGSAEYSVTSNTDWTASSDSAWCLVTSSGSGNGTIVANYAVNPYHNSRVATISVVVAGLPAQTATLTQAHSTISIQEFGMSSIRLYPNPAKGLFSIIAEKSKYPLLEVSILDVAGEIVLSRVCQGSSEYLFDLGTSPQGYYLVKIKTATEVITRKLVILK